MKLMFVQLQFTRITPMRFCYFFQFFRLQGPHQSFPSTRYGLFDAQFPALAGLALVNHVVAA